MEALNYKHSLIGSTAKLSSLEPSESLLETSYVWTHSQKQNTDIKQFENIETRMDYERLKKAINFKGKFFLKRYSKNTT